MAKSGTEISLTIFSLYSENGLWSFILDIGSVNVRLIEGKVENGRVIISSFSRKGL
jgi:hypothetical protein